SMFYIAEYSNMVTASALMTTLFFGGWDIPFSHWDNTPPWAPLKTVLTLGMFSLNVICFLFVDIWLRWTVPRFRYDQLMALGWKVLLALRPPCHGRIRQCRTMRKRTGRPVHISSVVVALIA